MSGFLGVAAEVSIVGVDDDTRPSGQALKQLSYLVDVANTSGFLGVAAEVSVVGVDDNTKKRGEQYVDKVTWDIEQDGPREENKQTINSLLSLSFIS